MKMMKFIEKVLWITAYNKLTVFLSRNEFMSGLKYVFYKGDSFDRTFLIVSIVMNIFILNWLFSFIFVVGVDIIICKYILKLWKKALKKD